MYLKVPLHFIAKNVTYSVFKFCISKYANAKNVNVNVIFSLFNLWNECTNHNRNNIQKCVNPLKLMYLSRVPLDCLHSLDKYLKNNKEAGLLYSDKIHYLF